MEGQQHRGKDPAKITPIVDRPHIYTNKELAENIDYTGYHLQQVASIARKLALLQEGEYASQAQQIANTIAAETTKLILDRAKGVVGKLADVSGAKDVMGDTVELIVGQYQNDFIYRVAKKFDDGATHLPLTIRTNWGAKMHLKDSLKDHLQDRPWLINQIIDEIPKEHLITAAQTMGTKGSDLSAVLGYIPSSSKILDNLSPMSGVAAGDAYDGDDMPDLEETDDKGKRKEPELSYEDKGKEAEPKPVKLDDSPFIVPAGSIEATANTAPENTASVETATHTASAQDQTADSIIFINQPDDLLSRWFNDPSTPAPPSLSAVNEIMIRDGTSVVGKYNIKIYDASKLKYEETKAAFVERGLEEATKQCVIDTQSRIKLGKDYYIKASAMLGGKGTIKNLEATSDSGNRYFAYLSQYHDDSYKIGNACSVTREGLERQYDIRNTNVIYNAMAGVNRYFDNLLEEYEYVKYVPAGARIASKAWAGAEIGAVVGGTPTAGATAPVGAIVGGGIGFVSGVASEVVGMVRSAPTSMAIEAGEQLYSNHLQNNGLDEDTANNAAALVGKGVSILIPGQLTTKSTVKPKTNYNTLDKQIKTSEGTSYAKDNISFNSKVSSDNSNKIKTGNASGTSSGASNLKGAETTKDYIKSHIDAKNPVSAGDADIKYGDKDSQIFARKIQSDGIYYAADEFKINKEYYNKLWKQGRPAPFLQARQILDNEHKISVDLRGKKGFLKYEGSGLEMIYNPTTKEIWHIMPSKKKR